jgi:hypothetical protein
MNTDNITKIHDIYVNVLNHGADIYKNNDGILDDSYLFKLKTAATYITELNNKLMSIINISNQLINGCIDRIDEVKRELNLEKKYKGHPEKVMLVFKELNKGLQWGDISNIEDRKEKLINNIDTFTNTKLNMNIYDEKIIYKSLNKIYDTKLDFDFKLPIISDIKDIPPSLYWYNGDSDNIEGIYMSLNSDVFIRVPFPDTVDYMNNNNKKNTIKCKNKTIDKCKKFRDGINVNNNYVHNCNYLHSGDKFLKINNMTRSSNNSRLGKHSHINKDLEKTTYSDIQSIMLYSVSDILLNSIWIQKQQNIGNILKQIITDIEISV